MNFSHNVIATSLPKTWHGKDKQTRQKQNNQACSSDLRVMGKVGVLGKIMGGEAQGVTD